MAGMNNLGLGVVFSATDLITPIVLNISSSLLELDKRIADVTTSIRSHFGKLYEGVGAALEGVSEDIFKFGVSAAAVGESFRMAFSSGELQRQLEAMRIQTGFISSEMEKLASATMGMSIKTGLSTRHIATGLRDFATAGLNAAESTKAMSVAVDMAAASFGDVSISQAVEILTTSVNVFSELGGRMDTASDIMIRAVSRSKLKFSELAMGFSVIGKSAQGVGATLEDSFIALGEVRGLVPSMERASTGVSSFMSKLQEASTQSRLGNLGANIFNYDDGVKKLKPFLEVIAEIANATKGFSQVQRSNLFSDMFGAEALTGLVPLINRLKDATGAGDQNLGGYLETVNKWRKEIRTMGDDTATAAFKARNGFNELWNQLKNTFSVISDEIGMNLIEALTPILKVMLALFKAIAEIVVSLPSWFKSSLAHIIAMASTVKLMTSSFNILSAVIPVLASNIWKMVTALKAAQAFEIEWRALLASEAALPTAAKAAGGVAAASAVGGAGTKVIGEGVFAASIVAGTGIGAKISGIFSSIWAGLGTIASIARNFVVLHPVLVAGAALIGGSIALYNRHVNNMAEKDEEMRIMQEGNAEKIAAFQKKSLGFLELRIPALARLFDWLGEKVHYLFSWGSEAGVGIWNGLGRLINATGRSIEALFTSMGNTAEYLSIQFTQIGRAIKDKRIASSEESKIIDIKKQLPLIRIEASGVSTSQGRELGLRYELDALRSLLEEGKSINLKDVGIEYLRDNSKLGEDIKERIYKIESTLDNDFNERSREKSKTNNDIAASLDRLDGTLDKLFKILDKGKATEPTSKPLGGFKNEQINPLRERGGGN